MEKGTGVILKALEPSFEAGPDGGWIRLIPQENDSRPFSSPSRDQRPESSDSYLGPDPWAASSSASPTPAEVFHRPAPTPVDSLRPSSLGGGLPPACW